VKVLILNGEYKNRVFKLECHNSGKCTTNFVYLNPKFESKYANSPNIDVEIENVLTWSTKEANEAFF